MVVRGTSVRVEKRVTDRTLPRVVLVLDCVHHVRDNIIEKHVMNSQCYLLRF